MPKDDKFQTELRIRMVQEWLIEDWPSQDIVTNVIQKWGVCERQARRYISKARARWVEQEDIKVQNKRKLKIESLKKLKRSLHDRFKGTPAGIRAVLQVEKEIIALDGLRAPIKLEHSGPNGQPIQTENSSVVLYLPDNKRQNTNGSASPDN
ncbi:MAG: hypothetical protein ACTHMM_16705 [Agriterribacter sp.]